MCVMRFVFSTLCIHLIIHFSDIINTVISVSHYPPLLVSEPQISNYPTLWQNAETFQQRPEPESSSNEGVGFQEHEPGGWPVDGGQNMNLPFYSSELGQLPIHTPTGLGYNINGVTNEELAIFDSSSQSELANFFPSSLSYDLNQGMCHRCRNKCLCDMLLQTNCPL